MLFYKSTIIIISIAIILCTNYNITVFNIHLITMQGVNSLLSLITGDLFQSSGVTVRIIMIIL